MKKNILLLHGWNYRNYSKKTEKTDAWHNRMKLVDALSKNNNVYRINFPGFCGEKEPNAKYWSLDDYAKYVNDYITDNKLKIDYVLGYSFGGAVAVRYKNNYKNNIKLLLISPAIIRNFKNSKKFIKTPKVFDIFRNMLRDIYLIYVKKVPEMKYGTKFLRNSYQSIVREDLRSELYKISAKDLNIIYGSKDTQVDPIKMYNSVDNEIQNKIFFIKDEGHDIANTSCEEIMSIIEGKIFTK